MQRADNPVRKAQGIPHDNRQHETGTGDKSDVIDDELPVQFGEWHGELSNDQPVAILQEPMQKHGVPENDMVQDPIDGDVGKYSTLNEPVYPYSFPIVPLC